MHMNAYALAPLHLHSPPSCYVQATLSTTHSPPVESENIGPSATEILLASVATSGFKGKEVLFCFNYSAFTLTRVWQCPIPLPLRMTG